MVINKNLLLIGAIALGTLINSCGENNQVSNATGENQAVIEENKPITLTLASFAVTQSAYEKIIPQFAQQWEEKTGQKVTFNQSYGGSGSQTRAVIDGLEADVVALALSADVEKIESVGLIEAGWQQENPDNSIVTKSVVAFVSREGGKQVKTWADLTNPDIKVITANPKTSGGARWNFMALWGQVIQSGGTTQQAEDYVTQIYGNVPILPKDAREASDVFYKQGQGDILLNYENEILLAELKGEKQPYVVPTDYNISIDNPVAVVDKYVDENGTREVAEAFVEYLFTPEAQREFAKVGFRPSNPEIFKEFESQYPPIDNLFTIDDFGGWAKVQDQFFGEGGVFDQMFARINQK